MDRKHLRRLSDLRGSGNESTAHFIRRGPDCGCCIWGHSGEESAPPIVALLGLFGMVSGEQAGGWLSPKKIQTTHVASAHIVGDRKDQEQRPNVQSVSSTLHHASNQ